MCETQRELLRGIDRNWFLPNEGINESNREGLLGTVGDDFAARSDAAEASCTALFRSTLALHIPAKFQVIRE